MQAEKMALEKYRCARASPCACRMAYRVAEPRPIEDQVVDGQAEVEQGHTVGARCLRNEVGVG